MMKTTGKNEFTRQSNFELLRIVAMLFIVIRHFSFYGGLDKSGSEIFINQLFITGVQPLGKLGVDLFVLISAYFLVGKSKVTVKKTVKLWGQVFFYTCSFFIISIIVNPNNFSMMKLFESICPVVYPGLWFIKTYFVFFLLTPFLNMVVNSLDKKSHETVIALFFILWCLLPNIIQEGFQFCELLWFCFLFMVAAFIKKWEDNTKVSPAKCFLLAFAVFVLFIIYGLAGTKFGIIVKAYHPHAMNSVFNLLCSLFIFMGVKNINIKSSKAGAYINTVASATFGVYLIHDNLFVRNLLWNKLFNATKLANSSMLIPYGIAVSVLVFAVCICIDLIRIKFIEKPFMKTVGKYEPKINTALVKAFDFSVFCCGKVKKFLKK